MWPMYMTEEWKQILILNVTHPISFSDIDFKQFCNYHQKIKHYHGPILPNFGF